MKGSITLTDHERNLLLLSYRSDPDPALRLRAHILLLLADGHPWALLTTVLFCSSRTLSRWKARFEKGRVPALLGHPRGAPPRFAAHWMRVVVQWVTERTPRGFGLLRS